MLTENKKIVAIMSLKMSKTRIDKSYMYVNISLPHDNSTGSNKPHTKCQLTPWPGFVGTFDMVMFAANFWNNWKWSEHL